MGQLYVGSKDDGFYEVCCNYIYPSEAKTLSYTWLAAKDLQQEAPSNWWGRGGGRRKQVAMPSTAFNSMH